MKQGSKIIEIVGPSKGPGRKNKVVAKYLSIPATKELSSAGLGDLPLLRGGLEEVMTIPSQIAL